MSNNLNGKVVLVTGGASGIGFGIVDCFLEHGAKFVIILDIDDDKGAKAVDIFSSKYGERIAYYKCDVTLDLEETWENIIATYNNIDVLVNNAGTYDENDFKKTINVNTIAVVNLSLKFWEHARKDKFGNGGTIINIGSVSAYRVEPYLPLYQASKFAVLGFTKSIGHLYNYNTSGVRVIAVCPGLTETVLSTSAVTAWSGNNGDFLRFVQSLPRQKVKDVANAVLEVFEKSESGTAWEIEGAQPIVPV